MLARIATLTRVDKGTKGIPAQTIGLETVMRGEGISERADTTLLGT
jgi:hypothetical protein